MSRRPAAVPGRRRAWLAGGVVAIAAVVVGVIMLPTIMVRLDPPELRDPGVWRFTHVVEPAAGWSVVERILQPDDEYTVVAVPAESTVLTCVVALTRGSLPAVPSGQGRAVRIRYRPGVYLTDRVDGPAVRWQYGPQARAQVSCFEEVPEDVLVEVAEAVDFEDSRVRLPFLISPLPPGFRVTSIIERRSGAEVGVTLTPARAMGVPSVTVWSGGDQSDRCLAPSRTGGAKICLTSARSVQDAPYPPGRIQRALDAVEDRVRLSPDLADRSTWFDAVDLPTG